jgi:DNA repair exonuclease SbcCD ATPase subunit
MQKLNVKLILILGLIASLVLAANFFISKEREKLKRIKAEEELKIIFDEKKVLEVKLDKEIKEKETVKQELVQEKKWSGSLEEQLKEKEKQIEEALNKIEEKKKLVNEAFTKLEDEKKRSAKLEQDLQRAGSKLSSLVRENKSLRQELRSKASSLTPAIELEKIVVTTSSLNPKEGKILAVNKEFDFIVINLGVDDMKVGGRVSIIREGKLIAEARVERVEEKVCAATVLPEYKQVEIKESDGVRIH